MCYYFVLWLLIRPLKESTHLDGFSGSGQACVSLACTVSVFRGTLDFTLPFCTPYLIPLSVSRSPRIKLKGLTYCEWCNLRGWTFSLIGLRSTVKINMVVTLGSDTDVPGCCGHVRIVSHWAHHCCDEDFWFPWSSYGQNLFLFFFVPVYSLIHVPVCFCSFCI